MPVDRARLGREKYGSKSLLAQVIAFYTILHNLRLYERKNNDVFTITPTTTTTSNYGTFFCMSLFAQTLATAAQSFLSIAMGMELAISTIVIKDLYPGSKSEFSISLVEASWYGSLLFIIHPFGSFLSGILQERFGKKRCMIFANIPSIIGWILLYRANSSYSLCASTLMMGFSVGFGAGSMYSYVGEIAEPRFRGSMSSFSSIATMIGTSSSFFMGSFLHWRTVALSSTCCPIVCICLIIFIPESPVWLVSKGRRDQAEKSMCWLRGWVEPETIRREFLELVRYNQVSGTQAGRGDDVEREGLLARLNHFKDPSVCRPLKLLMIYFFVAFIVGITPGKPFFGKIMTEIGLLTDQSLNMVIFNVAQSAGSVVLMLTIHRLGKRLLTLLTLSINATLLLLLGVYIKSLKSNLIGSTPRIPLALISCVYFFGACGVFCVPWILLGEIFPNKSRGIATGTCAGMSYTIIFTVTKLYLPVESVLTLEYTMFLFSLIGFAGLIYFYFCLPETENKTLLEIEEYFSSNSKN